MLSTPANTCVSVTPQGQLPHAPHRGLCFHFTEKNLITCSFVSLVDGRPVRCRQAPVPGREECFAHQSFLATPNLRCVCSFNSSVPTCDVLGCFHPALIRLGLSRCEPHASQLCLWKGPNERCFETRTCADCTFCPRHHDTSFIIDVMLLPPGEPQVVPPPCACGLWHDKTKKKCITWQYVEETEEKNGFKTPTKARENKKLGAPPSVSRRRLRLDS